MVKVPTPAQSGAQQLGTVQPIAQRDPSVPNLSAGVAAAFRPWIQLAGGVAELGAIMQKQENERNLLDVQNAYQKFEREAMFGENGWASQQGEGAFGLTQRAEADINRFRSELLEGRPLNGATRQAAEQWLSGQANQALSKVASHEYTQREAHITRQMEAGLALAVETAASYHNNPAELARQTSLVMQRSDALLMRQGIDPNSDAGKAASLKASTALSEAVYYNKLANNPQDALAYLNQAEASGMLDATRASVLRAQVTDDAKRYAGKQAGAELFRASINATGLAGMSPNSFVDAMFGTSSTDVGPLIMAESSNRTDLVSSAGARGLSQAMPENLETPTSFGYGVVVDVDKYNAGDRETQWKAGRDYLYALYTHPKSAARGNPVLALMAYNWGIGKVEELLKGERTWESVPQETIDYVNKLLPGTFGDGKATAAGAERGAAPGPAAVPSGATAGATAGASAPAGAPPAVNIWAMYQRALAVDDPIVREATISELNKFAQVHSAAEAEHRNQITDEIYSRLDQGESLDAIFKENPTWRAAVGRSVPAMRQYDQLTDQEKLGPATDEGLTKFNDMLDNTPRELADMTDEAFKDMFKPLLRKEYRAHYDRFRQLKRELDVADAQHELEQATDIEKGLRGEGPLGWSPTDINGVVNRAAESVWGEKAKTKDQVRLTAKIYSEIELEAKRRAADGERLTNLDAMRIAQTLMLNKADIDYTWFSWDTSTGTIEDLEMFFTRAVNPRAQDAMEGASIRLPILDPETGIPEETKDGKPVMAVFSYPELKASIDKILKVYPKATPRQLMMLFLEEAGNY